MSWRVHGACVGFLWLMVLVAFSDVLGGDRQLFFRDHIDVFRPLARYVRAELLSGSLPVGPVPALSGTPAESMLFGLTPLTGLLLIGPFEVAYDNFIIAHFLCLASGTYVFLNALGARWSEALLGSTISALAGPVVSFENLVGALPGFAFAPWTFWALFLLLKRPRFLELGVFSLCLGFQVQGALPVLLLLDTLGGLALVAHLRPNLRGLFFAAVGVLVAAAFAAFEVFPFLEGLRATRRGAGFALGEASQWPLTLLGLLEFWLPALWSPPERPYLVFPAATASNMAGYFTTIYMGTALTLFVVGFRRLLGRPSLALGVLLSVFFFLVVSLGQATPVYDFVRRLPLLRNSRFPIKYTVLVVPGVAFLAVRGLYFLRKGGGLRLLILGALIHVIGIASLLILSFSDEWRQFLTEGLSSIPVASTIAGVGSGQYPALFLDGFRDRLFLSGFFALFILVIAIASWGRGKFGEKRAGLLAAVVCFDLALGARFAICGAPELPSGPPENVLRQIRSQELYFFNATKNGQKAPARAITGETDFYATVFSSNLRGFSAHQDLRYLRDIDRNAASPYSSTLSLRLLSGASRVEGMHILARAGVTWMGTRNPALTPAPLALEIGGEVPHYYHRVPDSRDYASLQTKWARMPPAGSTIRETRSLLVASDLDTAWVSEPQVSTATACVDAAKKIEHTYNRNRTEIRLWTESKCPAIVSVLETAWPRWRVWVDGQARSPLVSDFGHLSARLAPGAHKVDFAYDSVTNTYAIWSLLGAFLILVFLGVGWLQRRGLY